MLLSIAFVTRFLMERIIMLKIFREIFTRLSDIEALMDTLDLRIEKLEKQNKTTTALKKKAVKKNEK